ncbi:unnamed protein product [Oppiella nova]|uniref:ELYS-like domain-containing protein n=1 Tax=Oppiella nova TaxID=334625 RepID=A0A7R9LMC5_9ACAR|nr:unnamed protein product [Oppiella nova]CAG2164445.1 unnamed protein product [Oppiella nova]
MSGELSASRVSQVLPLVSWKWMSSEVTAGDNTLCPIRCTFSSDTVDQYLWLIKGSQLDIISVNADNVSNQRQLGSIDFSQVFEDTNIKILNVLQLMDSLDTSAKSKYIYTLAVSLRRSVGTCLICLIDVRLSLILKTIETPFKITSLEMISNNKANASDKSWPLIDELLQMNGILAIGTEGGLVFLLDLFLDYITPLSEALIPKKLSFIVCNSTHINLKSKRKTAALHDQLICLPLNSDSLLKSRFVYKADDGSVLSAFPKTLVSVTALQYVPQTAFLCVGFNFGGFQFFNMKTFKLECSCGLEYGLPPVVRFAFQDPENDPKNYSYIWVVRGQEIEDNSGHDLDSSPQNQTSISNAIMYSISFDNKEWILDYGILYTGFQGCSCRFEYILGPNPHFPDPNLAFSSRLIDCYTIPLGNHSSNKSSDDESVNLDLSLLFISWEAMSDLSETNSSTYFAIFDLNQWYRSQMPTDIKVSVERPFSPFLGVFSLSDIANSMSPDAIVSVQMNRQTITKFRSQAFQDDIHYYPSSLSFDVIIVSESQICSASYLGLPKRCLSQMVSHGSNLLIDPKEYVNTCVISGLVAHDLLQTTLSTQLLRQIVLTVALENDYLPFLIQVIKDWSSGELIHCGCDSKFILDWIWSRVSSIKNEIDSITYPLFNFSGQLLDNFNLSQLYAYESDLKSLNIMLRELQTTGAPTTNQGLQDLALRQEVTQLIAFYLRSLLWFYEINLLPEHSEEEAFGEREVAYPSTQFKAYYTRHRKDLHESNPTVIRPKELLLIDGIVDSFGPDLADLWTKGGGDGLYPPPNLHSLLAIFLLESASLAQKQALMLYSLLDLADFLSDRQSDIVEKIRLYPSVFGLKSGLIKAVQAFWGLDHKLFDFALQFLLDPVVKPLLLGNRDKEIQVFNDMQQRIVMSFLYQNEVKSALIYSQNCGQFALDTPLREQLHLNMLLVNQQISNAFQYQRLCRNETNATELLYHLFECCDKMGAIEEIFRIPLDQFEEEVFTNYLLTSDTPNAKQMLVLYLIVNNKVIDASNVLNEFREEMTNTPDIEMAEKTKQLILLINAYVSALPQSLTNLAKEIAAIEESKSRQTPKIIISDTVPIHVEPRPMAMEWVAPSKAIESIMEQIADIWNREKPKAQKVSTPLDPIKKSVSKVLISQNSPFLRTPTTDRKNVRKGIQSAKTVYPTPKHIDSDEKSVAKHKTKSIADGSSHTRSALRGAKPTKQLNSSQNELLTVLETPQIKRKSLANKSKPNLDVQIQNYFTPTSILKVKQMMRRSVSPSTITSPSISMKSTPNKTLESTSLQQKLRFSVPDSPNFTEDSVENPRLASIKDTFALKSLKSSSQPIEEMDESVPMDVTTQSNLIDFDHTLIESMTDIRSDEQEINVLRTGFVFSPPQTRSSAKKKNASKSVGIEESIEMMSEEMSRVNEFTFSQLEEQTKTSKQKKKTKSKQKAEAKSETIETPVPEEPQPMSQQSTADPIVRETPSRSPTPASYMDDSDSHKSDVSQVSSSKASTRSSRSSRTPTKKTVKKVTETPTHSMRLRGSTSKPKK